VSPSLLRAATRSSPLAKWQTLHIGHLLQKLIPETHHELVFVDTLGDRTQAIGTPLHQIGGQGVFVKEVQAAVLEGRADFAVHSAKDLPSAPTPGLTIVAVPERADVRDVLVGKALAHIPQGGSIATGSVRRRALLASMRPDIVFHELRGNINTRLEKAKGFDAIVMAMASLQRLELTEHIAEVLSPNRMLPMVGQGAIAVECRSDDEATIQALGLINDPDSHNALTAERAFLAELGTGCDLPVAALAVPYETIGLEAGDGPTEFSLDALVASPDGTKVIRFDSSGFEPVALGQLVAAEILRLGGGELLKKR
jgi:hydroxymethylbilane synthase